MLGETNLALSRFENIYKVGSKKFMRSRQKLDSMDFPKIFGYENIQNIFGKTKNSRSKKQQQPDLKPPIFEWNFQKYLSCDHPDNGSRNRLWNSAPKVCCIDCFFPIYIPANRHARISNLMNLINEHKIKSCFWFTSPAKLMKVAPWHSWHTSTLPLDESGKLTGQPIRKRLEAETWRSKCHKMIFLLDF